MLVTRMGLQAWATKPQLTLVALVGIRMVAQLATILGIIPIDPLSWIDRCIAWKPNIIRNMLPWAIWLVLCLAPNLKLSHVQKDAHGLMQIFRSTLPYVSNTFEVPQACKQMFHTCPVEPMNIIILLLPGSQGLAAIEGGDGVKAALVGAVMRTHLVVKKVALGSPRTLPVPNDHIWAHSKLKYGPCRGPPGEM